jgi:hypothetical protein
VVAYVNNCLPAERMTHLEEENKEVIWLLLKPPEPLDLTVQSLLLLCTTPGQSAEQAIDMNEYLSTCIDNLLRERPSSGIVIAGGTSIN